MPLESGTSLTHYEVLGRLGAGGMGEVYRARDTRLEREVAIKVLPEDLADDEERLRRFEREARTLASLKHANLAHVYGIDQVGDTCFIAMELVEGEDLAERIARGPLPVAEALDVCRQIAEGLEAAHEAGVVHRDLKPANVRVTPEGVAKVLDFGLAKPMGPQKTESGATTARPDSFLLTEEGVVLGTPTYMSPEQARGRPVDRRTDVWAFGCVLFECLTGERAFGGDSIPDTLAGVLEREPDWRALPGATPAHVRKLLARCLDKDPRTRLRDVGEARVALAGGAEPADAETPVHARSRRVLAAFAGGVLLTALVLLGARSLRPGAAATGAPPDRHLLRLTVDRPPGTWPARVSPDGRRLLYPASDALWMRDLAEPEAQAVPGTEGDDRESDFATIAWSADGTSIAFLRAGRLETLRLGQSLAEDRCALPRDVVCLSWADDGGFLLEVGGRSEGLLYLAPGAAEPEPLDWLDPQELTTPHRFNPSFLPGGDAFLITDSSGGEPWIRLASLSKRTTRPLVRGRSQAVYVEPGWIAWVDEGRLLVQAFDRSTSSVSGSPREVLHGVDCFGSTGSAFFGFSAEGTLVYDPVSGVSPIEWIDREGRSLGPAAAELPYSNIRLDRTGRWLAASVITPKDGYRDLWILDLERGTSRRFTHAEGWESSPAWSPDGKRIAFSADWKGPPNVYVQDVDGGEAREIVPFENRIDRVGSWSADGRSVLYTSRDTGTGSGDIWIVDVDTLQRRSLLATPADETLPRVSPDGRWVAYVSDETGRNEVYVATFPDFHGIRRVSAEGGFYPCWKGDSSEVYYRTAARAIASAPIGVTDGLPDPGAEDIVIQPSQDLLYFEPSPDASRFLVVRRNEDQVRPVSELVVGWERLLE